MTDILTGAKLEEALAARGLPSEGNADDKRAALENFDTGDEPKNALTRLDSDVTKPSVTAPGDGAADTTDPLERAQSVTPRPGPEALASGTVNAVVKLTMPKPTPRDTSNDRIEEYDLLAPDGNIARVRHNIDTGDTAVISTRPGPKRAQQQ